jgi:hypothetical protein
MQASLEAAVEAALEVLDKSEKPLLLAGVYEACERCVGGCDMSGQ